ncbi:DNA repair protein RecO [Streptococcus sp. sy018]|uniref:DNA repair protein RecO n=1 Tax=Streptococcus sp. sy018 TaxID=2600147 RepID=UPI0011B35E8A|nr:DNA repair protein RecO [Streptococcus sp. sy018]TWS94952.1 DNA repair protein RecO [Streptococcus sp. sy018]
MVLQETRGLILYNQNFREDDKLVKIFTEQAGKRMFFVKHASRSKLAPVIQPLTLAEFILNINTQGLSYIRDYHEIKVFSQINSDIFGLSYASYIVALSDAAISDGTYDPHLFAFLTKTLELMDDGIDYEILTNIFEIQILSRFGIDLNFSECVICRRKEQAFDFSFKYAGVLCPKHYHEDQHRSRLDPNVPFLLNKFQAVNFSELQSISLKKEIKSKLRLFIDQLYEEYVGIQLKSKKFLDQLEDWGQIMRESDDE